MQWQFIKRAVFSGVLAAGVAIGSQLLVGRVLSGYRAQDLISSVLPSTRYLANAAISSSATILALMLTLLSFSSNVSKKISNPFFTRIRYLSYVNAVTLVVGVITLELLTMPLQQPQTVSADWFTFLYYLLIGLGAVLSGLLVATVLMLLDTVTTLIEYVQEKYTEGEGGMENG